MQRILTSLPSAMSAFAFSRARRTIDELNGPQSPRSAVQTTRRWTLSVPVPANSRGAESLPATAAAIEPSTLLIRSAYGRAASAAVCARRSFEAATICMALVIFCVALVEAMRTRMSLSEAILSSPRRSDLRSDRKSLVHARPCAGHPRSHALLREGLGIAFDHGLELCG